MAYNYRSFSVYVESLKGEDAQMTLIAHLFSNKNNIYSMIYIDQNQSDITYKPSTPTRFA